MPYLLTTTKYAKRGDEVKVVSDRGTAVIVESESGNRFSVRSDNLCEEKPEPEVIIEAVKQRAPRESKKPLTQAEKLQLEYLNSIK